MRGVKHATAFTQAYDIGGEVEEVAMDAIVLAVTKTVVLGAVGSWT